MAQATTYEYTPTASDVKIITASAVLTNYANGKMKIFGAYLINSFSPGTLSVQYNVTPEGGGATGLLDATIDGATISTNGVVVPAKNRQVKKIIYWKFFEDLLPRNYTTVIVQLTWTDTDGNTVVETINTTLDTRNNITNLKNMSFGTDTTPTFEFSHPSVIKSIKARPVLEYGTTADFSTIDHIVTAFNYHNGSAYVAGDATNGETVAIDAKLKMTITATSAMSGKEYYRIRLVPESFI